MKDYRTPVEKELHVLIKELQEAFASHQYGRRQFQALLGHVRDARVHLDNLQYGCPSGTHACACSCAVAGTDVIIGKYRKA